MSLRLNGATSGYTEIDAPATAGNNTLTLPATGAGTLIATSDTGTVSTAMLADSSVSNAKLESGAITADKLSGSGTVGVGVGYVRNGAAALSGSDSYGHFTFEAANGTRMLVQWGLNPTTSTSAITTANFHTSFKSGCTPEVVCIVSGIVFGAFVRVAMLAAITTTNFQYQVRDQTTGAQANGIRWIAIGEAP